MRKYVKPLVAVAAGMAVSYALQLGGIEPLYAKIAGLVVVGLVVVLVLAQEYGAVSLRENAFGTLAHAPR